MFFCFLFFLAKSDLAFLFLRLMSDLHLAVIPLSSLSCSLLFLVDLDSDTPTSWRSAVTLVVCCEGVSLHRRNDHPPLFSSVDVRVFLDCWVHLCIFSLMMYQTVDMATPIVRISQMFFFLLFLQLQGGLFYLHAELFWPHVVFSQQNLLRNHLRSIPGLLSA